MIGHPEAQHFMEHNAIQAFWRLFREPKVQTNRAERWIAAPPFRIHALDKEAGKLKVQRKLSLMNKRNRRNPEFSPVPLIDRLLPLLRRRARINAQHYIAMAGLNTGSALFESQ